MRLSGDAEITSLRGKYLLIVRAEETSRTFEVNESFAYCIVRFKDVEFSVEDISAYLIEQYGIPEEVAERDALSLVGIWRNHGLIRP